MKKTHLFFILSIVLSSFFSSCTEENEDIIKTGIVLDIDGNEYHTVTIGSQVWMVENLKTTRYNNGDLINAVSEQSLWGGLKTGAWCNYDNDVLTGNKYGKLYNWYAIKTGLLAPIGWHVPTAGEWQDLQLYANSHSELQGSASKALASKKDWYPSEIDGSIGFELQKNDTLGFSALPSGARDRLGNFDFLYESAFWWCSDFVDIDHTKSAFINYNNSELSIDKVDKSLGLSVRCVKDYIHQQPSIEAISVDTFGKTDALISFMIVSNGGELITECGVCWSLTTNPTVLDNKLALNINGGNVIGAIDNLSPETNYYIKAYTTNILGTTYSDVVSITTNENIIRKSETVNIPAGTFTMGSPTTEANRFTNERQHSVSLSAFRMCKKEITNAQFAEFLNENNIEGDGYYETSNYSWQKLIIASSGSNDYGLHYIAGNWVPVVGCENMPVINVTWYGASAFAVFAGGALPTEAQWEYACRAGTTTPFNTGGFITNLQANYNWANPYNNGENTVTVSPGKTQQVGTYAANAYGLFDMHGNVWEWCSDWYGDYPTTEQVNPTGETDGSQRLYRGGAWNYSGYHLRSAIRNYAYPYHSSSNIGFRIVFLP